MKNFLSKLVIFFILIGASVHLVFTRADGYTDPFYVRFTTPKQNNLIIGTSRAAQGLQPDTFKKVMNRSFYNYSFSIMHSPFGRTYLESIKKKLAVKSKGGIFIVSVAPWSISSRTPDPNDSSKFREVNLCLGTTKFVCIDPNPFYLFNNLNSNYYNLLLNKKNALFLHDNGWLEVSVNMDPISVKNRLETKVKDYRQQILPFYKFSSTRLDYLIKTIQHLNNHGKVYLVRLPMHPKMMEIENQSMPDFESKLKEAKRIASGYLDLTKQNSDFRYIDGNHLFKESGREVSRIIGNWICDNTEEGIIKGGCR